MFLERQPDQVVPVSSGGQDVLASVVRALNSEGSGYPSHIDTELRVKFLVGPLTAMDHLQRTGLLYPFVYTGRHLSFHQLSSEAGSRLYLLSALAVAR
jgi:hypothetical protein